MKAIAILVWLAVVSCLLQQTARAECYLSAGLAEPERRLDVSDDTTKDKDEQLRRYEWAHGRHELHESEMLRREALGGGSGDDHTPGLSSLEMEEVFVLERNITIYLAVCVQQAIFAMDWRASLKRSTPIHEAAAPVLPPGNQTLDPTRAREALECLRTTYAVLSGYPNSKDMAAAKLIQSILEVAEELGTLEHDARSERLSRRVRVKILDLEDSFPQTIVVRGDSAFQRLFEDVVREAWGERVHRRRMNGSRNIPRWIEASYLLALKLGMGTGEIESWHTWVRRSGFVGYRNKILGDIADRESDLE